MKKKRKKEWDGNKNKAHRDCLLYYFITHDENYYGFNLLYEIISLAELFIYIQQNINNESL